MQKLPALTVTEISQIADRAEAAARDRGRIGDHPGMRSGALTPSSEPTTSSSPVNPEAAKAVDRLFSLLPPQDVLDPEAFLTATITLFAEYPVAVMARAAMIIPQRHDRPTQKQMRIVLEELYEPIEREQERKRAEAEHRRALPPPRAERTPEEQAAVDAKVAEVRRSLGIPAAGYSTGRRAAGIWSGDTP